MPTNHRRGNPNWGRAVEVRPAMPTEFELEVKRLNLTERTCSESVVLEMWCRQNRNRCYVPEELLKEWGIEVDAFWSQIPR
jgi:hypothetical protein